MEKAWVPLDTVARMYPSLVGSESPTCFRISAVLNDAVSIDALRAAVADLTLRFPCFRYRLGAGMFWHFLQRTDERPHVIEDRGVVCRDFFPTRDEKLLWRVLYGQNRISLECSHILTDGYGALQYLRYLVERYLCCAGILPQSILPEPDFSGAECMEDAYTRYFIKDIPHARQPDRSYQPAAQPLPDRRLRLIGGEINADSLRKASAQADLSVTQYLVAVYLWSLYCLSIKELPRPVRSIRLIVPVDLRNLYPSKTMRNFFAPVLCELLPFLGGYTFDEIAGDVKNQMAREIKPRFINLQISRNVSITNNMFVRLIPLILKVPIQRFLYLNRGMKAASGLLSNLGRVALPEEIEHHIERLEFVTSPSHILKTTAGVIGAGHKVVVTFCNTTADTSVEREFFTFLSTRGVRTRIYTSESRE